MAVPLPDTPPPPPPPPPPPSLMMDPHLDFAGRHPAISVLSGKTLKVHSFFAQIMLLEDYNKPQLCAFKVSISS